MSIIIVISFLWLPNDSLAQVFTPSPSSLDERSSLQDFFPETNVTNNLTISPVNPGNLVLPTTEQTNQELGQINQEFSNVIADRVSRELSNEIADQINRQTAQQETSQLQREVGERRQTLSSLEDRAIDEAVQRELGATADAITNDLNPPLSKCDPTKDWDAAISIIKGKVPLEKVINQLNGEDKFTVELITDLETTDLSLLLLDNENPFLKGRILVGDEPKQDTFDYDIELIDTVCHQASLKDKTNIIKSNRNEPAVIPSDLRLNPIFAQCAGTDDFAKYRITGKSAELEKSNNIDGTVDLTVKLFVDLKPAEVRELYTVPDDNRLIAARLIVDEGISDREEIFSFILDKITSDCNAVDFLGSPTNIAGDDIVNPLHGFG